MNNYSAEDIGCDLGLYFNQLLNTMRIGVYIEKELIKRYEKDQHKHKEQISFTDVLSLASSRDIFREDPFMFLKIENIPPSLAREMILCVCYGNFDFLLMKTCSVAISMVDSDPAKYSRYHRMIKRLGKEDININLHLISSCEEAQMIRDLRNIIMHNGSVIPDTCESAKMKPEEFARFVKYIKDRTDITISFDKRIDISNDFFKYALETLFKFYQEVSNLVYKYAISQPHCGE